MILVIFLKSQGTYYYWGEKMQTQSCGAVSVSQKKENDNTVHM